VDERICPVCRRQLKGRGVCPECGSAPTLLTGLTAAIRQLLQQALVAMQEKSYLQALTFLEQGLKINRRDSQLLLMAGLCHYALGDLPQAEYFWKNTNSDLAREYRQKSREEQAGFERVLSAYRQALPLMQVGRYRQTVKRLSRPALHGHQYLPALELLALACYSAKQYRKARRVIRRIKALTHDAPVLEKLDPELREKSLRFLLRGTLALLILVTIGAIAGLSIIGKQLPSKVRVVYRQATEPDERIDRELLRTTARNLVERGDNLNSADILVAIADRAQTDLGLNPAEKLIMAKATVHYYYRGRHRLRAGDYDAAALEFSKSRSYPVHSYVYDDILYYQAIVKERLGAFVPAVTLYRQLIQEEFDSNYRRAAVLRWGALAERRPELRSGFTAVVLKYPEFTPLTASRIKLWRDGEL
jgi:tetratricopeptide (TPR) repeat protein